MEENLRRPSTLHEINALLRKRYNMTTINHTVSLFSVVERYSEDNDPCEGLNDKFYIFNVRIEGGYFNNVIPQPYTNVLFICKKNTSICFLSNGDVNKFIK